jgi:hypothetical protein
MPGGGGGEGDQFLSDLQVYIKQHAYGMEVRFKVCDAMFSDKVVTTSSEAAYSKRQVYSFSSGVRCVDF